MMTEHEKMKSKVSQDTLISNSHEPENEHRNIKFQEEEEEDIKEFVEGYGELEENSISENHSLIGYDINSLKNMLNEEKMKNDKLRPIKLEINQAVLNVENDLIEKNLKITNSQKTLRKIQIHCQMIENQISMKLREIDDLKKLNTLYLFKSEKVDKLIKSLEEHESGWLEERVKRTKQETELKEKIKELKLILKETLNKSNQRLKEANQNSNKDILDTKRSHAPEMFIELDKLREKMSNHTKILEKKSIELSTRRSILESKKDDLNQLANKLLINSNPKPNVLFEKEGPRFVIGDDDSDGNDVNKTHKKRKRANALASGGMNIPIEVSDLRSINHTLKDYLETLLIRITSIPNFERLLEQDYHLNTHLHGIPCDWNSNRYGKREKKLKNFWNVFKPQIGLIKKKFKDGF
ncbi:hypothetical protein CROQUDRAFT_107670 [Cronartium quercuum f. sp. fusiforme G11]|uniref:Uncharacterized protein n=1 Tax=Cronartium quercuum f. sp. fusiforme G11 TaxID=708437 RepID=A0A9P6NEZ3_9BASI|nr:hypothetical protein CROQUDRAFT_107670 [Cronartium quercuum f. sp. fusiforme G11]